MVSVVVARRIPGFLFIAALSGVLLAPAGGALGWPGSPHVNLPLCLAPDIQGNPAIASDGAGGAIVAWWDRRAGYPNDALYAQRFDAPGNLLWAPGGRLIHDGAFTNLELSPDRAGGAFIVWADERNGPDDPGLFAQRVDLLGNLLWAAEGVPICTVLKTSFPRPALVEDGEGGLLVIWEDARNDEGDVFAQRLNANGATLWGEQGVPICTGGEWNGSPRAVTDDAGGAIVSWLDEETPYVYDISAQRISGAGELLWGSAGVSVCDAPGNQLYCRLVSDGASGAFAFWSDERPGVVQSDLYGQRLAPEGEALWMPDGLPLCVSSRFLQLCTAISDGAGGAVFSWFHGTDREIHVQRVDEAGTVKWGSEGVHVIGPNPYRIGVATVPDGTGGGVVIWVKNDWTMASLFAQRVDGSGTRLWNDNGVALSYNHVIDSSSELPVLSDGNGGAFAAWPDERNSGTSEDDIYAQRLYHDGSLDGAGLPTPTLSPLTPTATITPRTPSATATVSVTATVSPTSSPTLTASPTWTATVTPTPTVTNSPTPSGTATGTATITTSPPPWKITLSLTMPGHEFSAGDECSLACAIINRGEARSADLYVLLAAFGNYWSFPSWQPLSAGLDHVSVYVYPGEAALTIIPAFAVPAVSPTGPLYFYAAMFDPEWLDLAHQASNFAEWELWLGQPQR